MVALEMPQWQCDKFNKIFLRFAYPFMPFSSNHSVSADSLGDAGRSWMVVKIHGQDFALRSESIAAVYRTSDAVRSSMSMPSADIEVHGGRPWFIVSPRQLFLIVDEGLASGQPEWTVAFIQPEGVAIHVELIEGPYRGVVMQETLKTSQGTWPLLRPLS